uniref:Major facilitator superfamily (MFS) profile domain-containing protein n=1 Tax=Ciona savignyi TaxID=51511 RepID=H2ZI90_CIOSA
MATEMSCPNQQLFWQSSIGIGISAGIFLVPIIGHPKALGNETLWPVLVGVSGLPSALYLISSWWIPESPYYLLRKGKVEDAADALRKLRINKKDVIKAEIEIIRGEIKDIPNVGIKVIVSTSQYRKQLFAVILLHSNYMLVGFNHVAMFSDIVFAQAGIPLHLVTFASIGVFGVSFIAAIFGSKVVGKFGPLKVTLVSNAVIIFSIALFTATRATSHLAPTILPYITIVAVGVFLIVWTGGLNVALFPLFMNYTIEATRVTVLAYDSVVFW